MLSKDEMDFILRLTDYFHGHWEDPGWGRQTINELLVLTAAHTILNGVSDADARRTAQVEIEKSMVNAAHNMVKVVAT